jgi:anaerobic magnesium-protoporphyrin IX monomethyl ester cyclase
MKITLIHPPLDDPTLPYHSTAYLAGHLHHNGFKDVAMRDLNVEFVNYCITEPAVNFFYEESERRLADFRSMAGMNLLQQEEYLDLWRQRRIEAGDLAIAARQLRARESFLDYSTYLKSVDLINRYFGFLGSLAFPSAIGNLRQLCMARFSIYSLQDLFNQTLSDKLCFPLQPFFQEKIAADPEIAQSDCLGISIVYDHQMSYALWLARNLRQRWPEKRIVLGGTSISQFYKYMKNKNDLSRFFSVCDAIVVGEGETAICEIANTTGDLGQRPIPNTITYDAHRDVVRLPERIHYENVPALGAPRYDHPWELYLSPARGVNYSPTRGCYWNRCTFCDYGLNTDRPTSPWRERKIDQVVADLRTATERDRIEYVYFAVDVMAPGYVERLSDSMLQSEIKVKWAAELRMEKIFSPDRCQKMAQSGCVCISFGMESGNQRILDLIDKGTKVAYMGETMKNFADAGIGVQIMAFKGFPTETEEEKKATYDFVQIQKDNWSTGGIGTFVLTGTALVAKNPEKFGIRLLDTPGIDIARSIAYTEQEDGKRKVLLGDADESFNDTDNIFPEVVGRPWAGGTDTLHSMIFYAFYGRKFFKENVQLLKAAKPSAPANALQCRLRLKGKLLDSPFDILAITANKKKHNDYVLAMLRAPAEPTYADLSGRLDEFPLVKNRVGQESHWIASDCKSFPVHPVLRRILIVGEEEGLTLEELFSGFGAEVRKRLLKHIDKLYQAGMISLEPSDRATGFTLPINPLEIFSQTLTGGAQVVSA